MGSGGQAGSGVVGQEITHNHGVPCHNPGGVGFAIPPVFGVENLKAKRLKVALYNAASMVVSLVIPAGFEDLIRAEGAGILQFFLSGADQDVNLREAFYHACLRGVNGGVSLFFFLSALCIPFCGPCGAELVLVGSAVAVLLAGDCLRGACGALAIASGLSGGRGAGGVMKGYADRAGLYVGIVYGQVLSCYVKTVNACAGGGVDGVLSGQAAKNYGGPVILSRYDCTGYAVHGLVSFRRSSQVLGR